MQLIYLILQVLSRERREKEPSMFMLPRASEEGMNTWTHRGHEVTAAESSHSEGPERGISAWDDGAEGRDISIWPEPEQTMTMTQSSWTFSSYSVI